MPTESEFRDQMRGDDGPTGSIDLDRVIRRARARRTPRIVAIAAGSVLAVAVIAVPVTVSAVGMRSIFQASGSGGSAADGGVAPEKNFDTGGSPSSPSAGSLDFLAYCGAPLSTPPPAANGLVLTMPPIAGSADVTDFSVEVRMTNIGSAPVRGITSTEPIIVIADSGNVVWHSNGATDLVAVMVDLTPGESMTYRATIHAVRCGASDEADPRGFPTGLPPLGAGDYSTSAMIDFIPDGQDLPHVWVTGPASTLSLH